MEFEKENDIMDQRQEMMDDAIDDVTGLEDEAEGEEVVEQVLEEIGIDLKNAVSWQNFCSCGRGTDSCYRWVKLLKVSRARLWPRAGLHKLLVVVQQVQIRETMISKLDWTA